MANDQRFDLKKDPQNEFNRHFCAEIRASEHYGATFDFRRTAFCPLKRRLKPTKQQVNEVISLIQSDLTWSDPVIPLLANERLDFRAFLARPGSMRKAKLK